MEFIVLKESKIRKVRDVDMSKIVLEEKYLM